MVNERYSVRKKFATIATLKKPIGEELNISGTDGIIIFNEDSIAINSNVKNTLTIIGGDGTTTHHTINDINAKDQKTELLFYYSGLQNATEYTLKITQDALKDAWGNKCAQMNFTNGFTTKKAEILSIMRSEHAKEKTNIDTLLFTVILEQGANYIPQQNDFIVTNGNLVQNNPIT
ncbi:hypothetical protein SDC9_190619 [bioreactor metagenome]|uniref:SbsA Ig-like domain-containing protein n=1 Tax=bioreactor metagenome TaxID=1076179 RepID=A0A645HW18_9ZZZZ